MRYSYGNASVSDYVSVMSIFNENFFSIGILIIHHQLEKKPRGITKKKNITLAENVSDKIPRDSFPNIHLSNYCKSRTDLRNYNIVIRNILTSNTIFNNKYLI